MEEHRIDISGFTLKIVAIVAMACNHVANVFADQMPVELTLVLYTLGGITFPIMGFLLTEGYVHTSNIRRYVARLVVFALIAQIPYSLLWGFTGNVIFTLLIGLGILYAHDHMTSRGGFIVVLLAGLFVSLVCDWGLIGPLMIYLYYLLRNRGRVGILLVLLIPFVVIGIVGLSNLVGHVSQADDLAALIASTNETILGNATNGIQIGTGTSSMAEMAFESFDLMPAEIIYLGELGYGIVGVGCAALLLCGYRGRRGYPSKWLFYVFYPAHLLVIWIVRVIFFF